MKATEPILCHSCQVGHVHQITRDYIAHIGEGQKLTVPNVEMEVCDKCDAETLSLEAARQVDAAIADFTDRLTPGELAAIREEFGVDQTEMSEILGLGSKTFHRWEKGSQYPSRSMGYYLRVLGENPEAFEWLRSRGWRGRNRLAARETSPLADIQARFPVLAGNPSRLSSVVTTRFNYAGVFFDKE